jgi:4-amino-4-deoxy-L-arabinose transferase-like glycosyltransferase
MRSERSWPQTDARTGDWAWLGGLWIIVTAYNLFKPYHIDDTAHLEIARWIVQQPLHPMRGLLNWSGSDAPIWHTNQPHLYFYLLAAWSRIFGFGEAAMHALQSLFSLACILLFHRLARAFYAPSANWATAIIVLGPAFIVEQNLMVDVPLLAAWLSFFVLLVCHGDDPRQNRRYALAGLACAAAQLIKYSSLVLLPILCLSLAVERRQRQAWSVLIPIAALTAWSLFNYWDYGAVHIATRPEDGVHGVWARLVLAADWFVGVGALTPLGIIAAAQWLNPRHARLLYVATVLALVGLAAGAASGRLIDSTADKLLWLMFLGNGLLCVFALAPDARATVLSYWRRPAAALRSAPLLYLLLWIGGTALFYMIFTPFMAARHILLVLPPLTLVMTAQWKSSLTRTAKIFGLFMTIAVSAGLCLSDWRFAEFYRSEAATLKQKLPNSAAIWASGHWGWQWYAERNGFPEVDIRHSSLKPGDLILIPKEVDHQPLQMGLSQTLLRTESQTGPEWSLICSGRNARFYGFSGFWQAPWSLSLNCLNHIDVFRIER